VLLREQFLWKAANKYLITGVKNYGKQREKSKNYLIIFSINWRR